MIIKDFAKAVCSVWNNFSWELARIAEQQEVENKLAAVSSFEFVFAFRAIAEDDYLYIHHCKSAVEMLASGTDQEKVLQHFENKLQKKKDG
jgi:hypothetical protein